MNKYHVEIRPWVLGGQQVKSYGLVFEAENINEAISEAGRRLETNLSAITLTIEKTNE
jgi:hypothetical protein